MPNATGKIGFRVLSRSDWHMSHTPGRGHRRKSDPSKKERLRKSAAKRRAEADKRYDEAKRAWEEMSDEARKMRPELDPELIKPRWRMVMLIVEELVPPRTQRTFANTWGELDYLCKKIRYWLYTRKQKARAKRFLDSLVRVLHDLPENDLAILREEGLALLYELRGKLEKAIVHRQREIELMQRLHRSADATKYTDATRAYMFLDRDTSDLENRRVILEALRKANAKER
jgi:hypothetical protein